MEPRLYELQTVPSLRRLVAPLLPFELKAMEEDIRTNGGAKGVRVWGDTILVDYDYYEYCHNHNIPFVLVKTLLESEPEAVAWVCREQLRRKALSEEMRKYLIGRMSLAERSKKLHFLRRLEKRVKDPDDAVMKITKHNITKTHIREHIAAEYFLVYSTVQKYECYSQALDMINGVFPGFVTEHLAGKLKLSFSHIDKLSRLPDNEIYNECHRLLRRSAEGQGVPGRGCRYSEGDELEPVVSIKSMPEYDPDAEIVSLSLTSPSWVSSILRVRSSANMMETSEEARAGLKRALIKLKSTTDKMLTALRKEPNESRV